MAEDEFKVDPPLLENEYEVDVSAFAVEEDYPVDCNMTVRGDVKSIASHARIERLIAKRLRERREH